MTVEVGVGVRQKDGFAVCAVMLAIPYARNTHDSFRRVRADRSIAQVAAYHCAVGGNAVGEICGSSLITEDVSTRRSQRYTAEPAGVSLPTRDSVVQESFTPMPAVYSEV